MSKQKQIRARRATIRRDEQGKFHYTVQGGNWAVIDESEQGFTSKRYVLNRIDKRWPKVEQVIDLS